VFSPRGRLTLADAKEAVVSPDGSTAYVAVTDGYATVDLADPASPELLAERRDLLADEQGGPLEQLYDVKLSGDTLAVVGPANPSRGQTRNGALLVDVSDPTAPEQIAFHSTQHPIHNCAFADGYLYLTGNGAGTVEGRLQNPMVVIDTTGDTPTEVARWHLTDHDEAWVDVPAPFRTLHDLWVRDGLAALAHWDAGTYLLDVSDPTEPTHRGTIPALSPEELADAGGAQYTSRPGNHHYVTTDESNEILGIGGESWGYERDGEIRGGPSGIDLYDVSDPTSPEKLSTIEPPAATDTTYRGTWTTAHNFELRDGTLYSAWYHGGVKRHDVSDPASPEQLSWWVEPTEARFWTAQAGVPGEFFVAPTMGTETADAGLWVFPETDGTGGTPAALTATPTPTPSPGGSSGTGDEGTETGGETGETGTPDDGTAEAAETRTATPTATPGRTASPTPAGGGSASQSGATEDAASQSGSGEGAGTTATAAGDGETVTRGPGLGVIAALGGLGLGAWRARRGRNDRDHE
jgi:hypothetical protein